MALNPRQAAAVTHDFSPLLIIAGAGTGKTNTLAHRVAHLITSGADAGRILLLTFTRRAAEIMVRRASSTLPAFPVPRPRIPWAGTFHSIASRLLRLHASSVGRRRNILDFPTHFDPPAHIVKLEQNYRSTQPILDASNAVIGLAAESFRKNLFSERRSEQKPVLVAAKDEQAQADYIVERVLAAREAGVPLHHQAVLMRTAHHSDLLEIELGRRNIPFVKYGGLKFLEAAHVKDVVCILRWAENPRDDIAGFRVLLLLPGVGPAHARRILDSTDRLDRRISTVPAAAHREWPPLCKLISTLRDATAWPGQLGLVRKWYEPHLERLYEAVAVRIGDLEQLETLAANHASRESFLSDLTLDPPEAVGDLAGDPLIDEDYLILSTIHSAKGQEWDIVYVLNVVNGCIPSDLATGSKEEIEEERRHAPRTRFIPDDLLPLFERETAGTLETLETLHHPPPASRMDIAAKLREMWS